MLSLLSLLSRCVLSEALNTRQDRLELRVSRYFKGDVDAQPGLPAIIGTPLPLASVCIVLVALSCTLRGNARSSLFAWLSPALLTWKFFVAEALLFLTLGVTLSGSR